MTTMTREQRTTLNADTFRQRFGILDKAGVGVTMIRAAEPYRVIDTLYDYTLAEKDATFRYWTIAGGWHTFDRTKPGTQPDADGNADVLGAAKAIEGFGRGVYVMMYPHPWIGKAPPLTQVYKDFARSLPETKKRLVILTIPGFVLPPELQNDITVLDFDLPSFAELRDVYHRTLEALDRTKRPHYLDDDIDRIISAGGGMTSHEFESAVSRALIANRALLPRLPIETMTAEVLAVKVEAVKRTEVLEVMPVGNMEEVGGLENLKAWVIERRACFGQDAADYGIDPLKGILLAGPPGTGKSLVSKAIAWSLSLPLIKFDVSRVFGSLVGQSEARVDEALRTAQAMAPCVLFLDEIDKALGGSHEGGGDSGVTKRVLGKILTWLQENDAPIFCVFSANRVEQLPTELIRRGRLDEIFSVSVPNATERREIFNIHLKKRKVDPATVNLDEAIEASEGYVPAELEAAVKDAKITAFNAPDKTLTGAMIVRQLRLMTPLSQAFPDQFASMRRWAEQNARPANGTAIDEAARAEPRPRQRTRAAVGVAGRALELDS